MLIILDRKFPLDNEKTKVYDKLNKSNQRTVHSHIQANSAAYSTLQTEQRAELIDGEMFMMAAPTLVHQDLLMWLSYTIKRYITEHKGRCKVLPAPFAVYIKSDQYNYVEPDNE